MAQPVTKKLVRAFHGMNAQGEQVVMKLMLAGGQAAWYRACLLEYLGFPDEATRLRGDYKPCYYNLVFYEDAARSECLCDEKVFDVLIDTGPVYFTVHAAAASESSSSSESSDEEPTCEDCTPCHLC